MEILNWSGSSEVKELYCGQKSVTVQCLAMTSCPFLTCPKGFDWEQFE